MAKRITIGLTLLILALGVIWAIKYFGFFDFTHSSTSSNLDIPLNTIPNPQSGLISQDTTPYKVEVVAENFSVPWSIVFTTPDRMLVSERSGVIKEVKNGTVTATPLITFSNTAKGGEIGLMGLAVDPDYSTNTFIYACVGYKTSNGFADKVIQLVDTGTQLTENKVVLDGIPAGSNHAGCELAFGPDNKLYISTGDATEKNLAQDLSSLAGKILRINSDGSIPDDNPFSNSPIFTYGHRNPQGIDWTTQGDLYEAEHGPSGNDGPGGGDEVNLLVSGSNYGWPLVSHQETKEGTIAPLITYTPAEAPSSLLIYKGDVFSQFMDTAIVATLRGEGLLWIQFDLADPHKIISSEKLDGIDVGRVRDVTQGPDGHIYFTSSNTDGRGTVSPGDDKIYRLVPAD